MRHAENVMRGRLDVRCSPPFALAGDQGDPEQSCDGNTYEMVECLKARPRNGTSG